MNEQQREHIGRVAVTLQIIVFSLVSGVLFFAGIVLFLRPGEIVDEGAQINTIMAGGAAVLGLLASVIVPRILRNKMRQAIVAGEPSGPESPHSIAANLGDVGSLVAVYQTTLIVGAAILEGAAFYNLIAYQLERQSISMIGVAMLLIAMFTKFPTRTAIENWVNDELKQIQSQRSLDG
jgi:hypothetical protein